MTTTNRCDMTTIANAIAALFDQQSSIFDGSVAYKQHIEQTAPMLIDFLDSFADVAPRHFPHDAKLEAIENHIREVNAWIYEMALDVVEVAYVPPPTADLINMRMELLGLINKYPSLCVIRSPRDVK